MNQDSNGKSGESAPDVSWEIKTFDQLSAMELHDLLKVRVDIFVVEQNCAYPEIDGKDPDCVHVIGKTEKGELTATARIAPSGTIYSEWSIGRVTAQEEFRRYGLGKKLMEISIDYCREKTNAKTIKIAAQLYLKKFYSGFGFEQIGEVYLWDGIDHIDMRLTF